jgi:hypothetical protein
MKINGKSILSMLCLMPFGLLAGCGSGASSSTPIPPGSTSTVPAVTQQPANQIATAGQTATFAAAASGTPAPTVQWQVSTNAGAFTNIAGATSQTLTLTGTTAAQNGNQYQAVFTNSAGSATTTAATLTVDFAPQVTQQPTNQTVNAGSAASFTASANGNPPPTVQWQVSTNGGAFNNIGGATSTTLTLTGTATPQNGNQYQAVFTNSVSSTTTTAATLTVNAPAAVSGAAFDGPVVGATIDAFSFSATGTMVTPPIATTVTDANGNYSITLPAGFSGPVLLTSLGGTYKDDVTGQTVQAAALSALIPNGMGTVTAELTPLTSMAAQLALQLAAASATSPGPIAMNLNMAIDTFFGSAGPSANTPLVDVTTANCAAATTQASVDISLLLAGLSQLAADNGVTSAALTEALIEDYTANGTFLGSVNNTPITVPLANGSGFINLSTIEGEITGSNTTQLPQTLAAAITAFQNSTADVCQVKISTATMANLNNPVFTAAFPPAGAVPLSVSGTVTGLNPHQTTGFRVLTTGLLNQCTTNGGCPGVDFVITGNGAFSATGGAPVAGFTGWRLVVGVSDPFNESCQIARPITGGVVPNTPVSITGIQITCRVVTYPIQVDVGGLASGQSVQLQNFGTDTLTVSGGINFFPNFPEFPTRLTYGSAYDATISTQPSSETCAIQGSGMGTVGVENTVLVICGTAATPSTLNNPNGLVLSNDHTMLYLANAGDNQVLVYSISRGPAGAVTALSLVAEITADIANPTRLAFDPTGEFLYVTNFGPPGSAGPGAAPSNGWVSVYDTANNYAEVVAEKISTGSIMRPLGVAIDRSGDVYVAENGGNAISVYQLQSSGAYQEASFSPLIEDAAGNQFPAPGALSFYSVSAGDYLFVGTNAGNVFLYAAPLTKTSTPLYTLSHGACSSAPSGPTGFGMLVRGISGGTQSDSSFFVSDFRGGDVQDYTFNNFFGTNTCPAALTQTPGGSNSFPEGLVIDAFGNVFVSNSGTNSLFVYANGGLTIAPTLTVH